MRPLYLNAPVRSPQRMLQIVAIVVLNLLIIALLPSDRTEETLSKVGSTGSEVRQIQTKLKNWGYFSDKVDGIYGEKTRAAVVWFQKKNGLTADGIAGPATLKAMGIYTQSASGSSGGSGKYSQSDYNLLARLISAEARGEPYSGQVAVGGVVLNRV